MEAPAQLNEKWIKASVLGTIWASSEIVLGSFLHNLRVPFSGNILTAIGIVILISATYKWEESGLFWRAGIICALLKTMSPSAIIFGPMLAIFSEAILLEFSVFLLGRTIPGFVLGAVLAMSWNLFQKIFNFIIFYGYNIVEVYTGIMQYAARQMKLQINAVWAPLVLLLIVYALFGSFSAFIGIRTGRKIKNNPQSVLPVKNEKSAFFQKNNLRKFNYSVGWLAFNIVLISSPLLISGKIKFVFWIILVVAIVAIWAIRYKRALRQLIRPKLWIFFIVITMITAFVFTRLQSDSKTIVDAIQIGVEMNLRAIILIMGFSVLGTELYNPKIREFFGNGRFRQLPLALELSVESLPLMIAHTPDLKTIIKNPLLFVQQVLNFADIHLNEIKNTPRLRAKIFAITGEIGSGKTSLIIELIKETKKNKYSVSGFYTKRILENNTTTGYDLVEANTENKVPFLRINARNNLEKVGKYYIIPDALETGKTILKNNISDFLIIDEIGKLELEDKGWAEVLPYIFSDAQKHLIITLRKEISDQLIEKFKIETKTIFSIEKSSTEEIIKEFRSIFFSKNT